MLIKTTNYAAHGQGSLLLPHSFTGPAGQRRAPEHGLMASAAIHRTKPKTQAGSPVRAFCARRTCTGATFVPAAVPVQRFAELCVAAAPGSGWRHVLSVLCPNSTTAASPQLSGLPCRGPHVHMCRHLLPTLGVSMCQQICWPPWARARWPAGGGASFRRQCVALNFLNKFAVGAGVRPVGKNGARA